MVVIVANLADIVFKADGMVVNGTVAFYIIGEAVSIFRKLFSNWCTTTRITYKTFRYYRR